LEEASYVNYNWNWGIFWQPNPEASGTYASWLVSGLIWTLATALTAWVIALVLGSILGIMRTTPNKWLVRIGNTYVELFRNVPLLVQMFLWYFVLPEILPKAIGGWIKGMPPPWASFVPAVLCLAFFTAARVSEQVRAGINSLPRGQGMAGTAMGFTLPQTYRYVLLPMAFRIVMPPLTSEFMNIIKNSSVALTIGLMELTARARSIQEYSFQVFEAFTAATIIYVSVNIIVVFGFHRRRRGRWRTLTGDDHEF
jgi:glutamate/aspartate transport system permease protein